MTFLPDVNVILALTVAEHPHNPGALRWFERASRKCVLLSLPVRLGVLRLLTNPAVMGNDILTPTDAWRVWAEVERDERTEALVRLPATHDETWRRLVQHHPPARDLWTDAWLAAVSRSLPCRLLTFDRGFRRFDLADLELLD